MSGERDEPDGLWDLESLRGAPRLCGWMYEQFGELVGGNVVEVGAGIGTFSERMLMNPDVSKLILIEPARPCVEALTAAYAHESRVTIAQEMLPESAVLLANAGTVDFLLCQNVLEHIEQDWQAVRAMADALRPGGRLALLVPAHPWLYGDLDRLYGHHRRYTRERLSRVVSDAALVLDDLYSFNCLGVPGWLVSGRRRSPCIGETSLRIYEALLRLWQPVERRRRPPFGLSLVAHAHKPESVE